MLKKTYFSEFFPSFQVCKHLLSILIARAVNAVEMRRVNEEEVARFLSFYGQLFRVFKLHSCAKSLIVTDLDAS